SNGNVTQITSGSAGHSFTSLGNGVVVYNKFTQSIHGALFYQNLSSRIEQQLTANSAPWNPDTLRTDGRLVVWRQVDNSVGRLYYSFLDTPDISITTNDISFTKSDPNEGEMIDASVTLHNIGRSTVTNDITVRIYDG